MRLKTGAVVGVAGLAMILAGCNTGSTAAPSTVSVIVPTTVVSTAVVSAVETGTTEVSTSLTVTSADPTAGTQDPAASPLMPDVVCMNLQDAQDLIQTAGVFYSRSEDGTGRGRMQVLDRNWIVLSQVPAPGTEFGEGDAVLTVVKYGEQGNSCQ